MKFLSDERRAAGLCGGCGRARTPGMKTCGACRDKVRASKAHREAGGLDRRYASARPASDPMLAALAFVDPWSVSP